MNVALAADRRRIAKKFRNCADRRFNVCFCLFVGFELFLFAKRNRGQYRAASGPGILCAKIFTRDLA